MSIIRKYQEEGTQFDNLKYKTSMGASHPGNPPLIQKRVPSSEKPNPPFSGNAISARLDDVGRIGQLIARSEGLRYLANNTNLLNSLPLSKLSRTPQQRAQEVAFQTPYSLKDTLKTLVSTLKSIPVAGTGTHFIKGALEDNTYLDFINREGGTFSAQVTRLNSTGTGLPDPNIKQWYYNGGTKVNRVEDGLTTQDFYSTPESYTPSTLPEESTLNENPQEWQNRMTPRKPLTTIYQGEPGKAGTKYDSGYAFYYKKPKKSSIDRVNEKQPYNDDGGEVSDFITFTFEILQPEPDLPSTFLQFRAFLDNFSDSYSSSWNKFNYVGRADSFYSYQAFDRNADVSFKVATATRAELDPIYRKLNHLASTTAPTYSSNGIMRGTVTRLTIGDYFRDTPAIINDVNLTWTDGYPWEVDSAYNHLPHVLDCRVGLTILHKFTPQTLQSKFISIGSSDNVDDKATF